MQLNAKSILDELASGPRAAGTDADRQAQRVCERILTGAGFQVTREKFQFRILTLAGIKRVSAENLIAKRGNPNVWLVAHSDTKSQLMPPVMRVLGVVMLITGIAMFVLGLFLNVYFDLSGTWSVVSVTLAVAGVIPLFFNPIGNRSPGAVDNASGMATVLLSMQALPLATELGVLITSAEERFMAGARNFVRHHSPAVAVNCDGLDDIGRLRCWYNRGQKDFATRVAREQAAVVPPGILLDASVLSKHGWRVVTVSKGNWNTLWRIHSARDTASQLSGKGVMDAVSLVRKIVCQLV